MKQIPLPLPHQEAMSADDFLVTSSNREAAVWISKWPAWPAHGFILTGPAGSGKTHLMKLWLSLSGGRQLSHADLRENDIGALLAQNAALAIDDADALAGDAAAEEKLFHLFNRLKEEHTATGRGALVLTLSCGAGLAGFQLPDLRSRLLTLPAAALSDPDDQLLEALLIKQFRDRQVTLDAEVVQFLIPRMPRDAASLRALVEKLDRQALAEGRKITIALAKSVLENIQTKLFPDN